MKIKLFNTTLSFSYAVIAVMTCVLLFDKNGGIILCFLSSLIHEAGHITAMLMLKSPPEKIKLCMFGIEICDCKRSTRNKKHDLIITLAGVTVNFLVALLVFLINLFAKSKILFDFFAINLTIGLFNLMPVATLDGGQALFIILTNKIKHEKASHIIDALTFILIFPTAVLGFVVLLRSKYNFSLLLISLYLIFALVFKKSKFL